MNKNKLKLYSRRGLLWGSLLLGIALVLGICVLIEMISFNHNHIIDLTPGKRYTFSDKTLSVLHSLDADVNIITFYKMGERDENASVLDMFAASSPRIKYRLIDMDRNPGKARMYRASHSGDTRIEYKGKNRKIPAPDENLIVNALLQMSHDTKKVLLVSKGHGERVAYNSLSKALRKEHWDIRDLHLAEKEDLPYKARSVLLINDPQKDFYEKEINMLSHYLQQGGKIILLLEPFGNRPNLERFLAQYRIILTNDIIVDKENKLYGGDYFAPIIPYIGRAPFTQMLRSPLLLSTARSVRIKDTLDFKITAKVLASSSNRSWARIGGEGLKGENVDFRENVDQPGPIPVAAWISLTDKETKNLQTQGEMICVGDSDFIDDTFFEAMGNKDFFLNTLEWSARDNPLISIRGKDFKYPYHYLDASQGSFLFWICVVVLPAVFLAIGVVIIIYRRAKG